MDLRIKTGRIRAGLDEKGGNDTSTRLSNKLLEWQWEHSCQCVSSPLSVFRDVREQEGKAVFFLYDSSVSAVIVAGIQEDEVWVSVLLGFTCLDPLLCREGVECRWVRHLESMYNGASRVVVFEAVQILKTTSRLACNFTCQVFIRKSHLRAILDVIRHIWIRSVALACKCAQFPPIGD